MGYKDASELLLEIAEFLRKWGMDGLCRCCHCGVSKKVCPVLGKVSDIIVNVEVEE